MLWFCLGIVQFSDSLISIGGTLFKVGSSSTSPLLRKETNVGIVHLDSTVSYIREISLSLSSKFLPICLVGPIGCGKSSIIKYTASLFGRQDYPHFISIQMSDQIDSRLLLGSYHSTDLPGQFVWKPGSLTRAVLRGHWILLEDVDSAPPDVIALFDGLIDTHKLSVPGYGEVESIHPDFRVFATYRTQVKQNFSRLLFNELGNYLYSAFYFILFFRLESGVSSSWGSSGDEYLSIPWRQRKWKHWWQSCSRTWSPLWAAWLESLRPLLRFSQISVEGMEERSHYGKPQPHVSKLDNCELPGLKLTNPITRSNELIGISWNSVGEYQQRSTSHKRMLR